MHNQARVVAQLAYVVVSVPKFEVCSDQKLVISTFYLILYQSASIFCISSSHRPLDHGDRQKKVKKVCHLYIWKKVLWLYMSFCFINQNHIDHYYPCQYQELNMAEAVEWMKQCLLLAADWSIAADPLRRQQCYELYAHGYDRLAEEVTYMLKT